MADFCVRWGDDVQPYVMRLGRKHIETLRAYCDETITRLLSSRRHKRSVLAVTPRVDKSMLKARAFHRFKMFGFDFELREDPKSKLKKREFVLHFTTHPNFKPEDMPLRLRRVKGAPLSARPKGKSGKRGGARTSRKRRKGNPEKRGAQRVLYRLRPIFNGNALRCSVLASRVSAKLYNMQRLYRRLSAQAAVMWRRRPTLGISLRTQPFLTFARERAFAPTCARLEPRIIGETHRVLLFTFVSREPAAPWDVNLFGELPDEGERIAV